MFNYRTFKLIHNFSLLDLEPRRNEIGKVIMCNYLIGSLYLTSLKVAPMFKYGKFELIYFILFQQMFQLEMVM